MPPSAADSLPRVGLMAGWGRYPIVVAEALKREGYHVFCLGVAGHADPALGRVCDDFRTIGLCKLGQAIRYFRRRGVDRVTMAGKIQKVLLFQRGVFLRHLPDWRAVRRFYPHFVLSRRDRKDDTLLKAVIDEFALDGIRFEPATDFAPELLVKPGQLTARGPTAAQWRDIEFGWELAKEMGRLDVGQSVVVKGRAAIAIEAIEGTDECIRRAGQLCRGGEFTLVKVAKPQQDMRFDVPTIGLGTLETLHAAGGRVLAVEAGRTIIIDQPQVLAFADHHRLAIVALENSPPAANNAAP
jgi:UDP-2,3-diacylglucosamine hydrolase